MFQGFQKHVRHKHKSRSICSFQEVSTYMEYGIVDECKVPCDMPFNLRRRWIFSVLFAFSHNLYSCQGKTGKLESRKTIELDDNNQHTYIPIPLTSEETLRRTCSFSLWKVPVKNLPRGLILNKKKFMWGGPERHS